MFKNKTQLAITKRLTCRVVSKQIIVKSEGEKKAQNSNTGSLFDHSNGKLYYEVTLKHITQ